MATRPLYKAVKEQLTKSLIAGEWSPGAVLPSEPKLAQRYKVGISTIRAAVRELEFANVLIRVQGKGTFVAHFDERSSTHKFLNIARHNGKEEAPFRKVLALERIDAPPEIAEALRLPQTVNGRKVFKLSTVVRLAAKPIYHSNVFLPISLFSRLRRSAVADGNRSLYSIYQQQFNVNVTRVIDCVSATSASPIVAKLCDIRVGAPVLWLKRIAYSYNDFPVEVRHNWINSTDHCYRIAQGDGG